jgi:hypothetical protein
VIVYLLYRGNELGKFDKVLGKGNSESASQSGTFYPCVIEGSVDGSPMEDRVKALAIEAEAKGITITGDYVHDYQVHGGEMHLTGHGFKFTIDANGQIVKDESRLNLFAVDYPCQGGMSPDGTLGIAVDVGGAYPSVTGRIVDGKLVGGEVRKGWMPHIYGVLNGTYRKL